VNVDVAIVGAGPAGSSAAIELARLGHTVVVLERDKFPRHKVCGEFLSDDATADLARWGLESVLAGMPLEKIVRGAFYFGKDQTIEFPLPRPATGISRYRLDALLAETARASGADVRFGAKVENVSGALNRGYTIAVEGESVPIRARVAVAAWGRWSALDLALGREFAARTRGRFFGWSRHDEGDSAALAGRVHLYFFRGGYCGLSRIENGVVNFAGVVAEDELRRRGAGWERFLAALLDEERVLREHLAPLHPVRGVLGTSAVFFERHAPVFRGIFGAGDAAGVRDPFTGGGQASAIRGGVLAASILAGFLRGTSGARETERAYRRGWRREFGARFTWDAIFRKALLSPLARTILLPHALPLVGSAIERARLKQRR
jgi:flavin-dependent dehydrogenase